MFASSPSIYRSAVCRTLLHVAKLDHLWVGKGLHLDAAALVSSIAEYNHDNAVFLSTVIALLDDDHEGPSLREILVLEEPNRTALRTALIAVEGSRQTQVWLDWAYKAYQLEPEELLQKTN